MSLLYVQPAIDYLLTKYLLAINRQLDTLTYPQIQGFLEFPFLRFFVFVCHMIKPLKISPRPVVAIYLVRNNSGTNFQCRRVVFGTSLAILSNFVSSRLI